MVSHQADAEAEKRGRQVKGGNFEEFPLYKENMLPTRLGNVLNAANEYSHIRYGVDVFIWWPRLIPLLPKKFRDWMDTALAPVQAMLNLSMIFIFLTISSDAIALANGRWFLSVIIFAGGLILAYWCYLVAVSQARDYGNWVRVAYDFHRLKILKQIHIPLPSNLEEERSLWYALNEWFGSGVMPWQTSVADENLPQLSHPFYYDKNK